MAFNNNEFCWVGVISTDTDAAKAFYTEALGWSVQVAPMGDGEATMFAVGDIPRAHLAAPAQPGQPSHFENYLRVEDVDATTKAAVANGGQLLVEPMDIPPGRFSVVTTPSGAPVSVYNEADEASSSNPPAGPGAFHWVELHSKDLDADVAWVEKTFGVSSEAMPMPQGPYHIFKDGERMVGGAMAAMNPEAPAMWLTWVQVEDVDATRERIAGLGGAALSDMMDVEGVGRMFVAQDPTGAVFGVITPPGAVA
ncbi:MAG: VOC family protein [Myxococcota bacterium]